MTLPGLEEKYEILRTLGEGGMGVVYLAVQKRIERKVAIKSIAPYLARDPAVRERFTAEAAVLARLNHPNIVTLYDYIEEENALYLIMEYVEGQPLSDLLQAGPLPLELIQRYFSQVLEAFAYAHEQNIVHRDIKPSNIMITAGGRVKVLDFGVARILQTDHSLTRTGMRLGTLMYMSPEQIKGMREIDRRSDIYSLGLVLYEMFTGRSPYPPDIGEFDLSMKIVQEPIFDLSHPPAEIPAQLIEVILRATEKEPNFRYQNCEEFLKDFQAALSGTKRSPTLPPTQIGAPDIGSQTSKKKQMPWIWIGGVAAVILLGSGWYIWNRTRQTQSTDYIADTSSQKDTTLMALRDSLRQPTYTAQDSPQSKQPQSPPLKATPPPPTPVKPSATTGKKTTTDKNKSSSADTPAQPQYQPKPVLQAEIQNFKEGTLIQKAKGMLVLRNVGDGDAASVKVAVHFLNKKGEIQYTDILTFSSVKAGDYVSHPIQARENGIKSLRVEILSSTP
ncbi:MAG: serine/threonine protein kinase [Bacteroidia bacterium]|nr:serine/threonine protein kinase [Bacteroidia bacterium]MCX7652883.1 serine/threonine protein kinase [Bacteroidia bacterium]MDW8416649.1 serine/threonine-protein kinase [Bacteroidia bacterium]